MCLTLLIISAEHKKRFSGSAGRENHFINIHCADGIADAKQFVEDGKVDPILISIESEDQQSFSFVRQSIKNIRETKVIFCDSHDELTAILTSFENHHPEKIKKLLSLWKATSADQQSNGKSPVSSVKKPNLFTYDEFIGISSEVQKVKEHIIKRVPTGTTILIQDRARQAGRIYKERSLITLQG